MHFFSFLPFNPKILKQLSIICVTSFYKLSCLHIYLALYADYFLQNFPTYMFIWTTRLFGTPEYVPIKVKYFIVPTKQQVLCLVVVWKLVTEKQNTLHFIYFEAIKVAKLYSILE